MAKDELLADRVSVKQCKQAVEALHQHQAKKVQEQAANDLLPDTDENVWLTVALKQMPPGAKLKPVKIPIVHPLVDPRTTQICLLTKDPQRDYKELLEANDVKFIGRVIGLEKLKGKFRPFEARRMLLKENGMFLADDRIIPLLPKLLGTKWFDAKKQPVPVCLTRKDLKGELERAISSTYMKPNRGTSTSIRIGTLAQKPSQILDNLKKALPAVADHIYKGWDNIQTIGIKTSTSIQLPIWNCSLDDKEGGRWEGLTLEDADDQVSDVEMEEPEVVVLKGTKGKKRAVDDTDDADEETAPKSKKRAKGTTAPPLEPPTKATKSASKVSSAPAPGKTSKEAVTVVEEEVVVAPKAKKAKISTPVGAPKAMKTVKGDAKPTKQTKTKIAESPSPPAKPVTALPSAPSTSAQKSNGKKRRAQDDTAITIAAQADSAPSSGPAASVAAAYNAAAESETPADSSSKKNKKKKKGEETPVEASPVLAPKAKRTSKVIDTAEPEPEPIAAPKSEGKKKSKAEKVASIVVAPAEDTPKKKSKGKSVTIAEPEPPVSVSKDELKAKRSVGAGEKKKAKVVQLKTGKGKSAKDALLGKKRARD